MLQGRYSAQLCTSPALPNAQMPAAQVATLGASAVALACSCRKPYLPKL